MMQSQHEATALERGVTTHRFMSKILRLLFATALGYHHVAPKVILGH